MALALLDNIAWHSLNGAQAHLATGSATARRYVRGLAPLIGFADQARPDFAALAAHCEVGEALYTAGWSGPAPAGWQIVSDTQMVQMVWHGAAPALDDGVSAVPLQPEHEAQILALQVLTRPGPFGPRALDFGSYFGCFEGDRLERWPVSACTPARCARPAASAPTRRFAAAGWRAAWSRAWCINNCSAARRWRR